MRALTTAAWAWVPGGIWRDGPPLRFGEEFGARREHIRAHVDLQEVRAAELGNYAVDPSQAHLLGKLHLGLVLEGSQSQRPYRRL